MSEYSVGPGAFGATGGAGGAGGGNIQGVWLVWDYGSERVNPYRTEVEALRAALKGGARVSFVKWGEYPKETTE